MTPTDLLADLAQHGVQLWAEGDHLHFRAPSGALTPELRAALGQYRSQILAALRTGNGSIPSQVAPLVPLPGPRQEFPISLAQQRLWFIDQLEPGTPAYNVPVTLAIDGSLDADLLERTLNAIIQRHEALRTSFPVVNGRPVQKIVPVLRIPLPIVDLRAYPDGPRHATAQRLAEDLAQLPFDLAHGPLVRASLQRLTDTQHLLHLTVHHIVADGWSTGVLAKEVAAIYAALAEGASSDAPPTGLAPLPIQYADFAQWQRTWLQGTLLDNQLAYWRRHLAGVSTLHLPTDRPRPPTQSFRGASLAIDLEAELTDGLKALGRQEGATLFMVLLAGFQALLGRYTGQHDVAVGSPIANRTRSELEQLIGFFVNSLVLRTDLSGDPSFRSLLARVREVTLGAYAHQDLPFERLVEELQPERDPARNPLFQVMFALQNAPARPPELLGLTVSSFELDVRTTRFDLELYLWEDAGRLNSLLVYDTDLFEAATAESLLRQFRTLLEGMVADPERRLSELPLASAVELEQLATWTAA